MISFFYLFVSSYKGCATIRPKRYFSGSLLDSVGMCDIDQHWVIQSYAGF